MMAGYGKFILSVDSRSFLCMRNCLLNFYQNVSKYKYSAEGIIARKPKRPVNPFLMYIKNVEPKFKQEDPNITWSQIIKKASTEWAKLESMEKEHLREQYTHNYETYIQQLEEFNNSLTTEEKNQLRVDQQKRQLISEHKNKRRKSEALGKPKKPASGFLLYISSTINEKDPNVPVPDWVRQRKTSWYNLSPAEKEKYVIKATASMTNYLHKLEEWERRMLDLGHLEVVRRKTLEQRKGSEDKTKKESNNVRRIEKQNTEVSYKSFDIDDNKKCETVSEFEHTFPYYEHCERLIKSYKLLTLKDIT